MKPIDPTQAESGSEIHLRLFTDTNAVEHIWRAFEAHAECTIFQTFDWLSEWRDRIGRHKKSTPAIVLGFDRDGQLLIIFPLAIEHGRRLRRLTWLGSDLCDYNAPLLATNFNQCVTPERFRHLWREIVTLICTDPRLHFDLIDMDKMPETVGSQRNPMLSLMVFPRTYSAHVATLGNKWESFYSSKRSSATQKRERRRFKELATHGDVRFVDAHERDEISHTIDVLIEQKRCSLARMGVEDIFARAGYCEFYRAIALNHHLRDVVHLSRIDVGAIPAATALGLRHRNRYYLVMSSYQHGDLARFGPGRLHLQHMMHYAIDRKIDKFDFTIGDEPYKRDWCDIRLNMFGYLEAITALGGIMVVAKTTLARGELFVRDRPGLRRPITSLQTAAVAAANRIRRIWSPHGPAAILRLLGRNQ